MCRAIVCCLLFGWASFGQGVAVHFDTLSSSEIGQRLDSFKNTNAARERQLHAIFEQAGCVEGQLTEQEVKHSHVPNLICTMAGKESAEIVVGGHFDFVDKGRGVVDNWSGCSLLPSLYQSLKTTPRRHTFVFVGFTDEEKGMVGSQFYLHRMDKDDIRNIHAMVNLDSLGTGPTEFELDRGDKRLANALAAIAQSEHLPLSVMNIHQIGRSDSDSFEDRHVPTLLIHSITSQTLPILHSPQDQRAAIRDADYYNTYRLLASYLAYLDLILDAPSASGN